MENFTILVIYKAKTEGAREQFVAELTKSGVLSAIRAEKGCLNYEYYFSNEDKCKIVLFEKWENIEQQTSNTGSFIIKIKATTAFEAGIMIGSDIS